MNVRGFFKQVLNQEPSKEADISNTSVSTNQPDVCSTSPKETTSSGMSGFLSGTSKFFDSVQTKKNGLISDLSSKLNSIRLPGDSAGASASKSHKTNPDEGDESSASEYGDDGDRPMYAEQVPVERQVSVESVDSLPETEAEQWKEDIKSIVASLFGGKPLSSETKANFQNYVTRHTGRSTFSKEAKNWGSKNKEVPEAVLRDLAQYMSHVLVHCNENDDFIPASQLLQAGFSIYHEVRAGSLEERGEQHYLYKLLQDQPIWQSMRFWNAAFFSALQSERKNRVVPQDLQGEEALQAVKEMHDNATFLQISKFLWRMHAFGITRECCADFMRKQANAEDLPKDKCQTLVTNLSRLYKPEE